MHFLHTCTVCITLLIVDYCSCTLINNNVLAAFIVVGHFRSCWSMMSFRFAFKVYQYDTKKRQNKTKVTNSNEDG